MPHGVPSERLPDGIRANRAATQGQHGRLPPLQQAQHELLLARPEGGLSLAIEERLERLPELALELAVGVERLDAELRGDRPRRARLPGSHEADEHEGAPTGGLGTRPRALAQ